MLKLEHICTYITVYTTYRMSGILGGGDLRRKTDWRAFGLANKLIHCYIY